MKIIFGRAVSSRRLQEDNNATNKISNMYFFMLIDAYLTDDEVAAQGELPITRTGDRLRIAREGAGLSLADVATRTRIT